MAKKKEKKKLIFEKVGLVFRSPVRADIMRQLSGSPQTPKELADQLDLKKQNLNYHLNELKKGGLIKTHRENFPKTNIQTQRGARLNGISKNGTIKVTQGVELTKNGKNVLNQYLNPLYEEEKVKEKIKKNEMEDD